MKKTISKSEFRDAFHNMGRWEQFSYEWLGALYDYIESIDSETGSETELDVIALCCEFTEYENLQEFQKDYGDEYESIRDIERETKVIKIENSDGFIICQF